MKLLPLFLILLSLLTSCAKVDLESSIEKTKALLKEQKLEEADATITPCLPAAKNNPKILVLAALAKANKQDKEDFLNVITQAKEAFADTTDSQSLALLGRACIEAKELTSAIEFLEQSLFIDPDNIYTVTLLINAEYRSFESMRRYSMNNSHFKRADKFMELKESIQYFNLDALIQVHNPSFDMKEHKDEVEQKLMKAMAIDQKNPTTLLNLAVCYDTFFRNKRRAHGYYKLYLDAVKLLPPDNTQQDKVKRRMTVLKSEI